jgi:hypothetical protein
VEDLANADPDTADLEALRDKLGWFCTAPRWLRELIPAEDWATMGPPAFMATATGDDLRALHREAVAVFAALFADHADVPIMNAGPGAPRSAPWPPGLGDAPPIAVSMGLFLTRAPYSQAQGIRHRIDCVPLGDLRATFWQTVVECLTQHGPFVQRCAICRRFFVAATPTGTQCRAPCREKYRSQYGKNYYRRKGGKATVAQRANRAAKAGTKRRPRRT